MPRGLDQTFFFADRVLLHRFVPMGVAPVVIPKEYGTSLTRPVPPVNVGFCCFYKSGRIG